MFCTSRDRQANNFLIDSYNYHLNRFIQDEQHSRETQIIKCQKNQELFSKYLPQIIERIGKIKIIILKQENCLIRR